MDHPSDEALLAYLEAGEEAPLVETHLARCAPCLDAFLELREVAQPREAPRRWAWAAAAVLLLALSAGWLLREKPAGPPSVPALTAAPPVVTTDEERVLGEAVLLTVKRGGSVRIGEEIVLERGTVRLESPGERIVLKAGEARIELVEGAYVAEFLPPAAVSWFLRDALAAEEGLRLTVLSGAVRVGTQTLKAGESLGRAVAWRGESSWTPLAPEGAVTVRDAARILLADPPEGGYVFEALVRKRQPGAEVGVVFQAAGQAWEARVGANLLPARESWSRVRVAVDSRACRVTLGTRDLVHRAPGELASAASPLPGKRGVGLRAWGGDVEVKDARWRTR